jgi:tetratricopeptide (TPR) repeat protein
MQGVFTYPPPASPARDRVELLRALGLNASSNLEAVAEVVGSVAVLTDLFEDRPKAYSIVAAWKHYLDNAALNSPDGQRHEAAVIALVLIREALSTFGANAGKRLRKALNSHGLNWLGTWRELNLRYAGQLYGRVMHLENVGDFATGSRVHQEAQMAWKVVEALDGRASEQQRKVWRGMRAMSRLWLARQDPSPGNLLLGAVEDFSISEECGDRSEEHFLGYAEALIRAHELTGNVDWLDVADNTMESVGQAGYASRRIEAAWGDLWFAKGMHARTRAPESMAIIEDDMTVGDEQQDGPIVEDEVAVEGLRQSAAAFTRARDCYDMALGDEGLDPRLAALWRIRRGQATARLSQMRRLLGDIDSPALSAMLRAAYDDLSLCDTPEARIHGHYWPSIVHTLIHHDLRNNIGVDLPEAIALVDRALDYAARQQLDDLGYQSRLHRLRLELQLRRAIESEDVVEIESLLGRAVEDALFPITGLIYGARLLVRPTDDTPVFESEWWRHVNAVVTRLHGYAADAWTEGARGFAVSHGVYLLHKVSMLVPTDRDVLRRMWTLSDLANSPGALTLSADVRFQRARIAQRYARVLVASGVPEEREEALGMLDETIELLNGLIEETVVVAATSLRDLEADPDAEPDPKFGINQMQLHSLVGDAYLRREALSPNLNDLREARAHLVTAFDLGNSTHELLGRLADAHARLGRRTRDRAALRAAIDLKREARGAGAGPSRESFSMESSVCYLLWRLDHRAEDYLAAVWAAAWAAAVDPEWPWPAMQLAELLSSAGVSAPLLQVSPPLDLATGTVANPVEWGMACVSDVVGLSRLACRKAIETTEFQSQILGGVSRTFVLDDPHRLLSTTFVLKPTASVAAAEDEADRLRKFGTYIAAKGLDSWADAVVPLAALPIEDRGILATRLSAGRTLFSALMGATSGHGADNYAEGERELGRAVELLAHIHAWRGIAPAGAGDDAVKRTRKRLQRNLQALGVAQAADLSRKWAAVLPPYLPILGKRDAHTENWIVTGAGHLVALDLQGEDWLPLGLEAAQLLEDTPLLTAKPAPVAARRQLADRYLRTLEVHLPGIGPLPAVDSPMWTSAYAAFALHRAVYLSARYVRALAGESSMGNRRTYSELIVHADRVLKWAGDQNPALQSIVEAVVIPLEQTGKRIET